MSGICIAVQRYSSAHHRPGMSFEDSYVSKKIPNPSNSSTEMSKSLKKMIPNREEHTFVPKHRTRLRALLC